MFINKCMCSIVSSTPIYTALLSLEEYRKYLSCLIWYQNTYTACKEHCLLPALDAHASSKHPEKSWTFDTPFLRNSLTRPLFQAFPDT